VTIAAIRGVKYLWPKIPLAQNKAGGKQVSLAGGWITAAVSPIHWLEHDREKWKPVFGKVHAQRQNLDLDPIRFNWIKV
jgi:hypothetical protein